jgi:ABC-type nitrate/sulfonate/bicarbonate transport system ATPase subunit
MGSGGTTKAASVAGTDAVKVPGRSAHITLDRVRVTYTRANGTKVHALNGVSLEVPAGEFVCLIGRSGEGKTTLLNVVAGLVQPTAGRVMLNGAEVHGPGVDRGVIFQTDSVFPWMRVEANVEFGLKVRGVPKITRQRIVKEHLQLVALDHVAKSWPREMSGGMRARVAVASVFANDPDVLLADEPFGSLDYVTRRNLQSVLLEMWERTQKTIIFVTHDVEEALTLASRTVVVDNGRVVDDQPVGLARPRTEDVLATPEALALKRRLLVHLGLEGMGSLTDQAAER